jgi:c(7)-type cytochrome triheme protein
MRKLAAVIPALVLFLSVVSFAQKKDKAPDEITIKAKNGAILFNHKKHAAAEKQDCKVCHDKLWPQSSTAPINFRPPHTKHEAAKASCGTCHNKGGAAFTTVGNCKRCHGTAKAS